MSCYLLQLDGFARKIWSTKGEEQQAANIGFINCLKPLEEGALGDKPYFGGDNFGSLDVALLGNYNWFYTYEKFGKFSTEADCRGVWKGTVFPSLLLTP